MCAPSFCRGASTGASRRATRPPPCVRRLLTPTFVLPRGVCTRETRKWGAGGRDVATGGRRKSSERRERPFPPPVPEAEARSTQREDGGSGAQSRDRPGSAAGQRRKLGVSRGLSRKATLPGDDGIVWKQFWLSRGGGVEPEAEDARGSPLAAPPTNSHGAGGARPGGTEGAAKDSGPVRGSERRGDADNGRAATEGGLWNQREVGVTDQTTQAIAEAVSGPPSRRRPLSQQTSAGQPLWASCFLRSGFTRS